MAKFKTEFERINRMSKGPLELPSKITAARKTIRLFMAYLGQRVVQEAIVDFATSNGWVAKKDVGKVRENIRLLTEIGVPRNHDELCYLVARAPALDRVALWAWHMDNENIMPEKARLAHDITASCLKTYHKWVKSQSRRRNIERQLPSVPSA